MDDYDDSELENRIDSWFNDKKKQSVFGFLGHINSVAPEIKNRLATFPQNVFCPGPISSNGVRYCLSNFDAGIVP